MSNEGWLSTSYVGVRYREHPTRKFNGKPDRYYVIRYRRGNNLVGEGAGWNSDGVTGQKAHIMRAEIIQNIREGKQPQSLAEKRMLQEEKRRNEELKKLKEKKEAITFQMAADAYFEWGRSNKKDWKNDVSRYENHLLKELSALRLKDISSLRLEKLKSELQKKDLAPKTINHCLTLIRTIYRKASMWDLYSGQIPTNKLAFPKSDNRRLRFLSQDEAKKLLFELRNISPIVHDQALLSLHTGLRFGEIANLCWPDIDLENGIIQVRDPKSGESRQAYITPAIKDVFLNLNRFKINSQIFVFADASGKKQPHVSNTFYRVVRKLKLNEAISDRRHKVCFHSLRHTFASWLAIRGTPLIVIKELMGHKSISMTERYSHLVPNMKRKAVEDLFKPEPD